MKILDKNLKLNYEFSNNEIFLLGKFLRDNQEIMPCGLETFTKSLENCIYNSLSLDEVRDFYL